MKNMFKVGDRVSIVSPHMGMKKGHEGIIKSVSTETPYEVLLDGDDVPHKWYTDSEMEIVDSVDDKGDHKMAAHLSGRRKELLESILAAPGFVVCSMDQGPPPEAPAEDFVREAVFYSGAKVERYDWWTGETYDLSFSMTGADLSTLNSGTAPVLNGHESEEAEDVIGVNEKAYKDSRGFVTRMRFSNREDVAGIKQDITDGILCNVSMGVSIQALDLVSKPEEKRKHYMATKWKPFEVSVVPIGADPGAKFLSKDSRLERLRSIDLSAPTGAASSADDSEQKARLALALKQRRFRVLGR